MHVVALSGSPSATSRSGALLRHVLDRLDPVDSRHEIVLRELPPAALLHGDTSDARVREARDQVARAHLVVLATPIYKASFSGLLKTFLDLLPPDALRGRSVLALGTGGSPAHLLALDYALRPVIAALGARHVLDLVYATEAEVVPDGAGGHAIAPAITARVDRALADLPARPTFPPREARGHDAPADALA